MSQELLETVISTNQELESIKGIGRIELLLNNKPETFTATWGGLQPDRLRLDVLSPTGQPVISFACDGEQIYLLSYSDNKLYRRKAAGNGLKKIVAIDISVADFLDIICGRIPIGDIDGARMEEREDLGPLLVVHDRSRNYIDTIFFDMDQCTINEFERRSRSGKLLFHVVFESWMRVNGFSLPKSISIRDEKSGDVRVDARRVWVNPEMNDGQFVLEAL